MDTQNWFNHKLAALKDDFDFRLETIILDLTEQISTKMKEKGMTRAQLATFLAVTPAAVTKILNGNPNFTLKTLLRVADALEIELNITLGAKKGFGKLAIVHSFPEVQRKQQPSIPTVEDDTYQTEKPKDFPFSWNSNDSTIGSGFGGSLSC